MEEINLDNNTTLCQKRMYYNSDGPCLLVRVGLRVTLGKKNKHQNVSTSLVTSLMPNLQTSNDKCHTEIVHPNSMVFLEQLFSLLRHCLLILLVCSNNNNNHLRGRRRHYLLSNHFTIVTWYCTKKNHSLDHAAHSSMTRDKVSAEEEFPPHPHQWDHVKIDSRYNEPCYRLSLFLPVKYLFVY